MAELGAEIARDYAGREPILVATLKASVVFIADLSRALPILHNLDFVELAGYGGASPGGHGAIRLLKDLDAEIEGRARPARRGRRRHRADAELPLQDARASASPR